MTARLSLSHEFLAYQATVRSEHRYWAVCSCGTTVTTDYPDDLQTLMRLHDADYRWERHKEPA